MALYDWGTIWLFNDQFAGVAVTKQIKWEWKQLICDPKLHLLFGGEPLASIAVIMANMEVRGQKVKKVKSRRLGMDSRVEQAKDFHSVAAASYYNLSYVGNVGTFVPKDKEEDIITPNHNVFLNLTRSLSCLNLTTLWSYSDGPGHDVLRRVILAILCVADNRPVQLYRCEDATVCL